MTVAGLMLVKDEADVIEHSLVWLLSQVDVVYVTDNGSTDGTREILESYADRGVTVFDDPDPAYYQSTKMTWLARHAFEHDAEWAVPVDADEFWRCGAPRVRLADHLTGLSSDYTFVAAPLYDHKTTFLDDPRTRNPALRMHWRFREPSKLPKVAVRLNADVQIGMGNHDAIVSTRAGKASSTGSPPTLADGSVVVEHYPWRSAEQFLRKITNGTRAYAATNLNEKFGAHWRAFGMPEDDDFQARVFDWYQTWGYSQLPQIDSDLIYSPFPV